MEASSPVVATEQLAFTAPRSPVKVRARRRMIAIAGVTAITAVTAGIAARRAAIGGSSSSSGGPSGAAGAMPPDRWPGIRLRRFRPGFVRRRRHLRRQRATAVGDRLRTMRQSAGLSPEQLAWRSGIGLALYLRIESGDPNAIGLLPLDLLYTMATALGSNPTELLNNLG